MTMAEYIERAAAVRVVLRQRKPANSVAQNRMLSIIQRDLLTTPAAEVAPVVRCKDCKHYDMGVCLKIYSDGNVHSAAWQKRKPDDFCSYGEQRDKPGCPHGQRGQLASCPVCGGFDTSWNPDTDESICKSCGFSTGRTWRK